jgi:hypothetical protein
MGPWYILVRDPRDGLDTEAGPDPARDQTLVVKTMMMIMISMD